VTRLALALAILAGSALVPVTADAVVVPGPNGPLVFTSGRTLTNETAQIWFLSGPGGGALRLTNSDSLHHRHSSWSPDRTKIAFARGPSGFSGPWDIYVQDLTLPLSASNPFKVTDTAALNEDRPSWSPDGTKLAYAKFDGAAWDVVTKAADGTGLETKIADDASAGVGNSGQFSRPQWSPDGQEIFYGKIIAVTPQDYDIYRAGADGSDQILGGTPIVTGSTNDYQPALAPDGDNLCFTRQDMTSKDIAVAPSTGGAGTVLIAESGDEYECAWSPDDSNIAFVRGAFGAGEIRVKNLESNDPSDSVTNDLGDNRFDGNPEWTYNPAPTCNNGTASAGFNSFVSIPLSCSDAPDPPSFAPNSPFGPDIVTPPANGVLGGISNDSVIYTPNVNFQGQDSFTFKSDDGTSDSNIATITITVQPAGGGNGGGGGGPTPTCAGQAATIVGTAAGDVLLGTTGNDVIVALGGNDRIRGGRGSDVICSGSGGDRVSGGRRGDRIAGGRGNDVLGGGSGNDRISGNGRADRLSGGSGRDSLSGGAGRDRLSGGSGRDRLRGNSGRDGLNGGLGRDRCNGGPNRDVATLCELLSRIP
jgi:Tol biopolymer transport system component